MARAKTCPFCRGVMEGITLERTIGGPLELEVCRHCDGIWFDAGEQFRLMPDATLYLIRDLQANRRERRTQPGTRLRCPRCADDLAATYDLCHGTQYQFFRCPNHHGVFFRFFDFMRSQGLLDGLSEVEVDALRRRAETVTCPNCGAPVALPADGCPHCGTPISLLDMDYLTRALRQLEEDGRRPAS
jgi:Zn-finger nucleic acid-binding protein